MASHLPRVSIAAILIAVVSACATTEYTFAPPTTKKGERCVEKCQDRQQFCRDSEIQRSQSANAQCQRESEVEFTSCLKYASDRNKCYRKGCFDYASTAMCDTDYRACYQNCGGKIGIIESR